MSTNTNIEKRAKNSIQYRAEIAINARNSDPDKHRANGDEQKYTDASMNFTKGLNHDPATGLAEPGAFASFRKAIDRGYVSNFNDNTRVPVSAQKQRKWEAPTAGFVMDPQGRDAQSVTMAPAPALDPTRGTLPELAFEMAEVYELALLRDEAFTSFETGKSTAKIETAVSRLNSMEYAQSRYPGRSRTTAAGGALDAQTVFRGSSLGVDAGPYVSCFLLMGNGDATDGKISYGAQIVNQRVNLADPEKDYMTDWDSWLEVQNGADTRNNTELFSAGTTRFIHTPRDLATYVHDDALYQAYLNACLILLSMQGQAGQLDKDNGTSQAGGVAPFNPSFEKFWGGEEASGFALWGGPHILSLVTEIATRGLKAVRWQKFNIHLRLRPEALAARLDKVSQMNGDYQNLYDAIPDDLLKEIYIHNEKQNALFGRGNGQGSYLLPMAFQEGSPMHPTYGAGHATVAGACVTMLKAFFDTTAELRCLGDFVAFRTDGQGDPVDIVSINDGAALQICALPKDAEPLTLLGELNKLAANISIGRNMGGVHYYCDYYDSLRMGEQIAKSVLQDQADGYVKDAFELTYVPYDATSASDRVTVDRTTGLAALSS
ncbi:MAG: vanadium-dependent haloperoxidase [Marinovum sp.]|nr:vanadium-dependent haloperoxidase [Marinovum sp.]